jgi:dienelactone hydrolase
VDTNGRLITLFLLASLALPSLAQQARPDQAEKVSWPSMLCAGTPTYACSELQGQGYLFATPGAKKVVLISHGSQGIDSRMFDYVDSLQKEGLAALVIDHWKPRGIGVTHNDYAAASVKGGNELNMASDILTAAEWLRGKGYEKVGSIGESQGSSAAIVVQQKWAHALVERNIRRIYASDFRVQPLGAVVGMYGYCGFRHALRDGYVNTPFLFITGEVDDQTPSKYCERYVTWMNERGGNARIVVLKGEGHSFDAPYRRQRNVFGPHYAKCDILVDETGVTELNSGQKMPGVDIRPMLAKCVSKDYHTGYRKDRFIAVPHWIGFFKEHL